MDKKNLAFELQIKKVDKDTGDFEGFGSIFDNVDLGDDVIVKGAFADSLKNRPITEVRMLWQHDPERVIGKFTSAEETEKGLFVKGTLFKDDIPKAREAFKLIKENAIGGMSIGFTIPKEGSEFKEGIRVIKKVNLWEISLVTFPMNQLAKVTNVKDIKGELTTLRKFEKHLRDSGFTRDEASFIATNGFKSFLRDSENDKKQEKNNESEETKQILEDLRESVSKLK